YQAAAGGGQGRRVAPLGKTAAESGRRGKSRTREAHASAEKTMPQTTTKRGQLALPPAAGSPSVAAKLASGLAERAF
ncbi:MAG: hypothetical protein JW741_03250, partial [Sedimentisphaerales bacterium]|nr:hypothetical protein [Sedimentisphaerales bacterium]